MDSRSERQARATYKSLLEDIRNNDATSFRTVLEWHGLPQDGNWYDYDLLMRAIRMNRKRMVMHLLNKRCRVNKPERLSLGTNTPLHLVAEKLGWCDVIEKMLQLKARVTDQNADGNTPLHVAFLSRQTDRSVNLLLQHHVKQYPGDVVNNDGLGFMHIACTRSEANSVEEFLGNGFSDIFSQVNLQSNSIYAGYSPLHFAVEAGKHDIVVLLCQYQADVYAQDRNSSTPLHLALEKRDSKMIDILCSNDMRNENYVNDFGVSHFMAACAGSDPYVVREYLEVADQDSNCSRRKLLNGRVAPVNHIPNAGYTPLHFACEYGRYDTVLGLLQIGAGDQFEATTTTHGHMPYHLAAKQQHADVCSLLEQFYYHMQQQQEQLLLQQQQAQLLLQQQQEQLLLQQQQEQLLLQQQQEQFLLQQQHENFWHQQQEELLWLQQQANVNYSYGSGIACA